MINLLPDTDKRALKAARHNVLLIRYIGISIIAIAALFFVTQNYQRVLGLTKDSAENIILSNEEHTAKYNEAKSQIDSLQGQITRIQTVTSGEIYFSDLFTSLAKIMPAGTVLKESTLEGIPGQVSLTFSGKTAADLSKLQESLQSSGLIMNVTFQPIAENTESTPGYPAQLDATGMLSGGATQ